MITENMLTQTRTDVLPRRKKLAGVVLAAAGAALFLLAAGTAAGDEPAMTPPADATTQPAPAETPAPAPAPAPAPTAETPAAPAVAPAADVAAPAAPAAPSADVTPAPAAAAPAPTTRPSFVTEGLSPNGNINMLSGHGLVITTRTPYKRVSIGQPDIADVNPIGPANVLITAKKAGSTQLILWDDQDHSQIIDVVVDLDVSAVRRQIKAAFADMPIDVSALNDTLALRGQVPSAQVAEQLVEIAGAYGKVHNFTEISGGQQIMLQVRIAEVSKTAERDLGVNFSGTDGVSVFGNNSGGAFPLSFPLTTVGLGGLSGTGTGTLFGNGKAGAVAFNYFIQALVENDLARNLAEPNLVAISGQEASFLAGGEFPVPVPQSGSGGAGVTTIEFHEFGVRLHFVPQVLGNGKIRIKVAPEVSTLNFAEGTTVNGGRVPAFDKQTVSTTVELNEGQTFALAGLLKSDVVADVNALPVLGSIPVLGDLFKSTHFRRDESELVIIVTPRLVAPMNPDQVPALPGEHWRYPSDASIFLGTDIGGPAVDSSDNSDSSKGNGAQPPQFHGIYGFTPAGSGNAVPVGK